MKKKTGKKKTAQPLDCRLHCAVQNQVNPLNPGYVSWKSKLNRKKFNVNKLN